MPATAIERLAGSRYMSRLQSVLRSSFALNNFVYFGGGTTFGEAVILSEAKDLEAARRDPSLRSG